MKKVFFVTLLLAGITLPQVASACYGTFYVCRGEEMGEFIDQWEENCGHLGNTGAIIRHVDCDNDDQQ